MTPPTPETIRSRMQSIESKLYYALLISTPHKESVEAMRQAREDAVAALDLLDKSEVEKWWDETEHNYANPIFYRLVPDSEGGSS